MLQKASIYQNTAHVPAYRLLLNRHTFLVSTCHFCFWPNWYRFTHHPADSSGSNLGLISSSEQSGDRLEIRFIVECKKLNLQIIYLLFSQQIINFDFIGFARPFSRSLVKSFLNAIFVTWTLICLEHCKSTSSFTPHSHQNIWLHYIIFPNYL